MRRVYDGPALDGREPYVTERPVHPHDDDDGETVYATDPEPPGEETVENATGYAATTTTTDRIKHSTTELPLSLSGQFPLKHPVYLSNSRIRV